MEEEVKEEKKIINDKVDGMLKEFEKLLQRALPVKGNAELVNQILYSPLCDETKEKVIAELLEASKGAIECQEKETNTAE